ncbi:MAG: hypothetical protein M3R08_05835, partial [Bacteroidota bacterium]|nr:hypothetical protein [Bacteroidota bacterium]
VAFSLIYFYYYKGGDTIAYFYSAVAMRNLALLDPLAYLTALFGDNALEDWGVYTQETGKPYQYVYFDDRTFIVIRLVSFLAIATFNSYLITTLLIASFSYLGVWACFRTMVSYFPQITGKIAISFLFIPSLLFWGSGIMKDTLTFSAVCWWVHSIDEIFYKGKSKVTNGIVIFLSALLLVVIKPYIFMVLFPITLLWLFYFKLVSIRNVLIKFIIVPVMTIMGVGLSLIVLDQIAGYLDKFALDDALVTIQVTKTDLLREDSYGANSFDIGELDGTWGSVFSKFPVATNAALFRPYLWESTSVVVALSGLENLWVLGLAIFTFLRAGPGFILRAITGNPLLLMCMTFALLFAFTVGVTTPNFGALVRFKIPMVPFFISALYMIVFLATVRRDRLRNGLPFDIREFRHGSAHLGILRKNSRAPRRKMNVTGAGIPKK